VSLPNWCVNFIDQVEDQLRHLPQPDCAFGYPFSAPIRKQGEPRPAFLAISYAPKFDPIKACVLQAARESNFCCEVTGDLAAPGTIMDQVWQGIRCADVVVADVTESNANVMIEIGMAAALGKEVIVIGENATLPFDIRHWRKITYDRRQLPTLQHSLLTAFGSVSARYPYEGKEPRF
jgi:nucleoside 2-deoxyribosyltransferase